MTIFLSITNMKKESIQNNREIERDLEKLKNHKN